MLRSRQKLGKYVIERRLAEGGFATVYQARDTIEGIPVALKIPYAHILSGEAFRYFRQEVRLVSRLEHPNILPLKNADYVEGQFVIVTALAETSLDDRLQKRISTATAMLYSEQMMAAVACAHEHHIIHCDIKPENFLLFPEHRIRLTDFGIARVAQRTLRGSGAGTVGYVAPEQAMGRPSFRSDVFSLGLVIYRMLAGHLPEWPYAWPPPGYDRLRERVHPDLIDLLRRSLEVEARKRFRDATRMLAAYERIKCPLRSAETPRRTRKRKTTAKDWQAMRRQQFVRQYGKLLSISTNCSYCDGPLSEFMQSCPWCGEAQKKFHGTSSFPQSCPRCYRGVKSDWHYCGWCYGPGFEVASNRKYNDRRYIGECKNPRCKRRQLMPFMKYCPWCRCRVEEAWQVKGNTQKCVRCNWGVLGAFWTYCPWCAKRNQD